VTVKGKFYGIGVGPGAPDLLTLKAAALLQRVPTVFVPVRERGESSTAMSIISPFVGEQEVCELVFPMTKDAEELARGWELAAEQVLSVLREGKDAAFVTLGDSALYSTHAYLLEALLKLEPELAVETVPGITSFSAAAALFNCALTCGQDALAVVPATRGREYLKMVLSDFENVVLLKVGSVLDEILDLLQDCGRLGDAVYISRCGMPGQVMLDDLASGEEIPRDYFSLIIVRKVEREDG